MSGVRMRHPISGGEYLAQPSQVPHLEESGWEQEPGQDVKGEEWPAELRRFEGQNPVLIRHPVTGGEQTVAESAVPFHRERGWQVVDEEAEQALEDLTVEQLRARARVAGLKVSGTKEELLERLRTEPAAEQSPNQDNAGAEPAQDSEEGE